MAMATLIAENYKEKSAWCGRHVVERQTRWPDSPLVQPLLDQLREAGFRLREDVYQEALRLAGEDLRLSL